MEEHVDGLDSIIKLIRYLSDLPNDKLDQLCRVVHSLIGIGNLCSLDQLDLESKIIFSIDLQPFKNTAHD